MKPNLPNTASEKKTFAKLKGFSIVGNSVSESQAIPKTVDIIQEKQIKKIASSVADSVFKTNTPSLLRAAVASELRGDKGEKGDKGQDGIPNAKIVRMQVCVNGTTKSIEVYAPE